MQERVAALGKLVDQYKPDFLALQNINLEVAKNITKLSWGQRYKLAQPHVTYDMRTKPCNVIYAAYPAHSTETREFKVSNEKRMLFYASFVVHDRKRDPHVLTIANVRLETEQKSTPIREHQLNETLCSMREEANAIVVGDLSLQPPSQDGHLKLLEGWEDAWCEAGNSSTGGYTVDPQRNPFIKDKDLPQRRPDRVLYRLAYYQLDKVQIVGEEPLNGLNISDHFGFLATFTPRDNPANLGSTKEDRLCIFYE